VAGCAQNATNAPFTVTHAGGSSTVVVNQRLSGGQWNLLGNWSFDSGTTYTVELTDDGTAGKVAADAIYIAPAGGPPSDAFTWTPAIPSSGIYQVYARWPASSANTGAAQYAVTHAGGTANVTLNQKQNGGSWMPLGSWNFAPSSGHKVTLAAAAEGTTIADAMLFVAAGVQPANLLYVHADHLGSPQNLTDATQATVWDGVFDPFGEEVAITGLAAMPMRFPGQYADEETGYSYNYIRDYDPTLGRYLRPDPLGLDAGVNVFTYVADNPVRYIDPLGLQQYPNCPPDDFCRRLWLKIQDRMEKLAKRHRDAFIDEHDLFYKHRKKSEAHDLYGSWDGHLQQYNDWKRGLKNDLDKAHARNCFIPPAAYDWLKTWFPAYPGQVIKTPTPYPPVKPDL
jgi:RHS repeat-associated protein